MFIRFTLILIALALIISVESRNNRPVEFQWYFGYNVETSLWLALVVAFFIGALLMSILHIASKVRHLGQMRKLNRKVDELTREIEVARDREISADPSS